MRNDKVKTVDSFEVWKSISKAWKILSRQAEMSVGKTGLTLVEVRVLHALKERGPLPITKLTNEIVVTPGAMTGLIDGLEVQKHLVKRIRSNEDRRVVTIKITRNGERDLEKAIVQYKKFVTRILDKLSKKERVVLFDLMQKLSDTSRD